MPNQQRATASPPPHPEPGIDLGAYGTGETERPENSNRTSFSAGTDQRPPTQNNPYLQHLADSEVLWPLALSYSNDNAVDVKFVTHREDGGTSFEHITDPQVLRDALESMNTSPNISYAILCEDLSATMISVLGEILQIPPAVFLCHSNGGGVAPTHSLGSLQYQAIVRAAQNFEINSAEFFSLYWTWPKISDMESFKNELRVAQTLYEKMALGLPLKRHEHKGPEQREAFRNTLPPFLMPEVSESEVTIYFTSSGVTICFTRS